MKAMIANVAASACPHSQRNRNDRQSSGGVADGQVDTIAFTGAFKPKNTAIIAA